MYLLFHEILLNLLQKTEDTHLLLIGPVTAQWYCDELTAEVKRLGLTGRFTLVPGLPPGSPLLRSALHSAYVFILPSLHEPFGIAALEAWAAGASLIASNAGGLKDFIRDGVNGLLIEENAESMSACLTRVLQQPGIMQQIGKNAARDLYLSWNDAVHSAMSRYEIVIDRYRSRQRPAHQEPMEQLLNAAGVLMEDLTQLPNLFSPHQEE